MNPSRSDAPATRSAQLYPSIIREHALITLLAHCHSHLPMRCSLPQITFKLFVHATQDLCEKVGRISERIDSLALPAPVTSSPAQEVPPNDGSCPSSQMPENLDMASAGRRIKIARRKGAPLVGRRDTASARQVLPAEVGNPAPLSPDNAGVACGSDAWRYNTASLVSVCEMFNAIFKG